MNVRDRSIEDLLAEDVREHRVFVGPPRKSFSTVWWYRPTEIKMRVPRTTEEYRYADEDNADWERRGGGDHEVVGKCVDSVGGTIKRTVREYLFDCMYPYQQVGFYDFAPEDPDGLWRVERYVRDNPAGAARELFELRARVGT